MPSGERRKMRDEDLGVADEFDHLVRVAHIFLQAVQCRCAA